MYASWQELIEAHVKGDTFATEALADALEDAMMWHRDGFPRGLLPLLFDLFDDPRLLAAADSHYLLFLFTLEWDRFEEEEGAKAELAVHLESSFRRAEDSMFQFMVVEILGSWFADQQAFDIFVRLLACEDVDVRAEIAHGFDHIVRDSGDKVLAERAMEQLVEMQFDPSEDVRETAIWWLEGLAEQGWRG